MVGRGVSLDGRLFLGGTDGSRNRRRRKRDANSVSDEEANMRLGPRV